MRAARLLPDPGGLDRAAALLRAGGLVAFPTETVYGLGADATSGGAVAGIFAAKDRPRFNPLIVHVPDTGTAAGTARLDGDARRLAEAFWPGPLTLVLPLRPDTTLSPLVTAGLGTVALRVPGSATARRLLAAAGRPIAAPSANPSGRVSATTADHVLAGLGDRIDAVLDGGPCTVGIESTIVAVTPGGPRLLRPGGLPAEAIADCLGRALLPAGAVPSRPASPGQFASHYAPRGTLRMGVTRPEPHETWLGFGPVAADLNLSPASDLVEAAANLFGHLQELDRRGVAAIAVSPIPQTGLGRAINDRLRRAAAPRP